MDMESMDDPKSAYHADALACVVELLHVAGAYVNAACSLSSMRRVVHYLNWPPNWTKSRTFTLRFVLDLNSGD